jgi:hypothetical protein
MAVPSGSMPDYNNNLPKHQVEDKFVEKNKYYAKGHIIG